MEVDLTMEQAWKEAKDSLNSNQLLEHFDLNNDLTVDCNVSPYGLCCHTLWKMDLRDLLHLSLEC